MRKTAAAKSRFKLVDSVKDIIAELKRVVWPTREEAIRLTVMVLVVCIIVGVFLGAIDYGFTELVRRVFI